MIPLIASRKKLNKSALLTNSSKGFLSGIFTSFVFYVLVRSYLAAQREAAPVLAAPSIQYVSSSSSGSQHDDTLQAIQDLHVALSKERLQKIAYDYSSVYRKNLPFPHVAIDGIFPESFLKLVLQELAEPGKDGCIDQSSSCFKAASQQMKSSIDEEEKMGMFTRMLFDKMKGSTFVQFLEELSGIDNIIADPHYRGSGLHFTAPGGTLACLVIGICSFLQKIVDLFVVFFVHPRNCKRLQDIWTFMPTSTNTKSSSWIEGSMPLSF